MISGEETQIDLCRGVPLGGDLWVRYQGAQVTIAHGDEPRVEFSFRAPAEEESLAAWARAVKRALIDRIVEKIFAKMPEITAEERAQQREAVRAQQREERANDGTDAK